MKSQFILKNVAFFAATLLHISFTVGQTLEPNNLEIIEKNKEPAIKVEVLSEDHRNIIQIFSSTKPSNTLEKKTLYYPLEFSGDKIIFWEKTKILDDDLLDGAIQIQLKLTCNAPYITKWKVDMRNQDTERNFYMNYNVKPLPRESETPFVLSTQGNLNTEDLKYNLTMLTVTGFVSDFKSASIGCVKYTNESVKSQMNIFQRFEDGTTFVEGNNKKLNIFAPYIPCSVHDPTITPALEHKDKKGTWNKIPETSTSFAYDWKLGYRKVNGDPYINHKKFRCLIISGKTKANVTYTFTEQLEKNDTSEWNKHVPILQADEYQFLPSVRQIRCSLDYSKLRTANLVGTLAAFHARTCVTPDYCFSTIHNQDINCTYSEESCTMKLHSTAAADLTGPNATTLDLHGQVSCYANIESDEVGRTVAQDYYYTGLSGRLFLMSKPPIQTEILDLAVFENISNIVVSCTALHFLTSAPLKLSVAFQNGTRQFVEDAFSGIEFNNNKRDSRFSFHKDVLSVSVSIKPLKAEGVQGFSCHAPWFNSTQWLQESKNLSEQFLKNIRDLVTANRLRLETTTEFLAFENSTDNIETVNTTDADVPEITFITEVTEINSTETVSTETVSTETTTTAEPVEEETTTPTVPATTTSEKSSLSTKSSTTWTPSTERTYPTTSPTKFNRRTTKPTTPRSITTQTPSAEPAFEPTKPSVDPNTVIMASCISIPLILVILLIICCINQYYIVECICLKAGRNQSHSLNRTRTTVHEMRTLGPTNMRFNLPQMFKIGAKDIAIDEAKIIGQGQFSRVYSGTLKQTDGQTTTSIPVVIKVNKMPRDSVEIAALVNDVQLRMTLEEKHPNIASILGVHHARKEGKVMIAMNLEHARSIREMLTVEDGPSYIVTMPGQKKLQIMADWCKGVAHGMEFLHRQRIIHGNLAAENILVCSNNLVKITGFSNAQVLNENSSYFVRTRKWTSSWETSGWKWMPMESLRYMEFSKETDVWSFGVVMWEIFSMGALPYTSEGGKYNFSMEFVQKLEFGFRLSQPKLASKDVYKKMDACWSRYGKDRPNFSELCGSFKETVDVEPSNSYVCV